MSWTIESRPHQASAKVPRRIYRLPDLLSTAGDFVVAMDRLFPVLCLSRPLKEGKIARKYPRQAQGPERVTRATLLTGKFTWIPIMEYKASDSGWLAKKIQYEVQTVE